jgi:hypothetical protein
VSRPHKRTTRPSRPTTAPTSPALARATHQAERSTLAANVVKTRDGFAATVNGIAEPAQRKVVLEAAGEYIAALLLKDRFERPTRAAVYQDALRALNRG